MQQGFYLIKCGKVEFNYNGNYTPRFLDSWKDFFRLPAYRREFVTLVVLVGDFSTYKEFLASLEEKVEYVSLIILVDRKIERWALDAFHSKIFSVQHLPIDSRELDILIFNSHKLMDLVKKEKAYVIEEGEEYNFDNIIGISSKMQEVFHLIQKVAGFDVTVLLTGESGTGKELVAKSIHYNSPKKYGNFIAINCAAIPRELLESELFGHVKGAFTGAIKDKKGKFELANGGTLFLDEIGELPLELQSKLLRVLQDKEITPVGSEVKIKVNVRIIAATNRELEKEIKAGKFREDLYYRLNVIQIKLPPLRERKEDIYLLVSHFMDRFNKKFGTRFEELTFEAIEKLMEYDWPGNVRELENTIERACVLGSGKTITEKDIIIPEIKAKSEDIFSFPEQLIPWKEAKEQFEKHYISYALKVNNYNVKRTASMLKIQRSVLYQKIRKYGLKIR